MHPFREAFYISQIRLFPEYVDAIEGLNAAHLPYYGFPDNSEYNEKALKYAQEIGMVITGGSDSHNVNLTGGGMAFDRKLKDIHDFTRIIRSASPSDYRATDGTNVYDPYGFPIDISGGMK